MKISISEQEVNKQATIIIAFIKHPFSIFIFFICLAIFPWFISFLFSPAISPDLLLTPTGYANFLTQKAAETPTPLPTSTLSPTPSSTPTPIITFTPSPSPTPVVVGEAKATLKLYSCPGVNNNVAGQISSGQSFVVLGWNTDNENRIWFLVKDFLGSNQQWVQKQDGLNIIPKDFDTHISRISCRE